MKKSFSILIIPTMLISSCALTSKCSALWKKWFHKGDQTDTGERDPSNVDEVVEAFDKMGKLTSYTTTTTMSFEGDDHAYFGSKKVASHDVTTMGYVTETMGQSSKTEMSYTTTSVVKIADISAALGVSDEEAVDTVLRYKYDYIEYGYEREVTFDFTKGEVTMVSSTQSSVTYTLYDQEAEQSFDYSEGEETRYNTDQGGMGLIDTKEVIDLIKDGQMKDGAVEVNADGEKILIKVKLADGYISSLEADTNEGVHIKIAFSKYDETSFTIPEEATKPVCSWSHDANTPYHYEKTKNGHRKYCSECYKFLGGETPHLHAHNNKGVCEICGYIDGQDDVSSKVIPGFEKGENGYYLKAEMISDVFTNDYSRNYDDDYSCNEFGDTDDTYFVYIKDGVVLKEIEEDQTRIESTCLYSQRVTYDLYKNLSSTELENIKKTSSGDARTSALKTYLASFAKSATVSGYKFNLHHDYSHYVSKDITLDECHKIQTQTCGDCNELIYSNVMTNHQSELNVTYEVIDACHKLQKSDCPVCHEHNEEVVTSHVDGDPVLQETVIDSCHKLVVGYCATCNEKLGQTVVENHTGTTHSKTITVDSCETKTLTICDSCNCVVTNVSAFNHQHTVNVICNRDTLLTYEFAEELGYTNSDAVFEFEYCEDCHRPVDGIIYEYSMSIDHGFNESYYTVHHLENGGDHTTYEHSVIGHNLDENGLCKYCHAKVFDLGDATIGFIVKYNSSYSYWDYRFYNKTTGASIDLYTFDDSPEAGSDSNGSYTLYSGTSYPGIELKIYEVEYVIVRMEISWSGGSAVILPTDF